MVQCRAVMVAKLNFYTSNFESLHKPFTCEIEFGKHRNIFTFSIIHQYRVATGSSVKFSESFVEAKGPFITDDAYCFKAMYGTRLRVTKAPPVNLSASKIFDLAKVPVRFFGPHSYLTGVTAVLLRWHLSNMNVIQRILQVQIAQVQYKRNIPSLMCVLTIIKIEENNGNWFGDPHPRALAAIVLTLSSRNIPVTVAASIGFIMVWRLL